MVDSVVLSEVSSHILPKNKGKVSEFTCKKCSIYENQLKEALEDLASARMIINILRKDLHLTSSKTASDNDSEALQVHNDQVNTKEWTLVPPKNYIDKKCKSASPQQSVMITNRFTPLCNLQTNNVDSTGTQEHNKRVSTQEKNTITTQRRTGMSIPTTVGGKLMYSATRKPTSTEKTSTHALDASLTGKKHKVKIVGDSHLKGIAIKIGQYLNTKFEVCSWVKPGAKTEELVNTLEKDCKCLDKNNKDDLVIINGGVKTDELANTLENRGTKTEELVNTLEKVHKCLDKNDVVVSNKGAKTEKLENTLVNGEVKTEELVNTLEKDCKCLDKNDVIVINGGVNDISTQKNQINKVVVKMARLMQKCSNSNIIVVNIPHRYDLNRNSVINLEIQAFNKKLNKIARVFSHAAIVETDLDRKYFTRHGMHLNNSGKECLSKLIATQINRLVNGNNKDVPAVPLNWKDELTDKQNIVNPDTTVMDEKSLNRAVTRSRRLPVTRSNDFLW